MNLSPFNLFDLGNLAYPAKLAKHIFNQSKPELFNTHFLFAIKINININIKITININIHIFQSYQFNSTPLHFTPLHSFTLLDLHPGKQKYNYLKDILFL
uniref:hypothetical protein n=1 Tax=Agaricus bitorquis TaxID=5343 RepID=UPI0027984199|nr:hypothetical protein QLP03_mgp039 [Agaricus bitorquis]WFG54029.1 hypothetical protein [Agaricus bitorquis]